MHGLKIALKVAIGFLFSINVIAVFALSTGFGIKADDTIRIIVTEATGMQRDVVIFQADLHPLIFHNLFWVCLAAFGFMMIFLFYIDHSFKSFLAPGVLSLLITACAGIFLLMIRDNLLVYSGSLAGLYIETGLVRLNYAAYGMLAFGAILVALSLRGDTLLRKKK